jgi:hypothetical protein
MSPGMILRLSYQETDDEVDVVEDDSDICLSPLTSIQKENKPKSASFGSSEEQNKRRRRARRLFFIGVLFFFPSFLSFFAAKNQIIIVKIE